MEPHTTFNFNTIKNDKISTDLFLKDMEERETYYKESIIINYQRYRALFHSKLINNILVDDRFIIRDVNAKVKDEFNEISGKQFKVGESLSAFFEDIGLGAIVLRLRQSLSFNEVVEFELTDADGFTYGFQMETILFLSPNNNSLLRCISIVKVSKGIKTHLST